MISSAAIKKDCTKKLLMVTPFIENPSFLRALVLCERDLSSADRDVAAILDFFGIPWRVSSGSANETEIADLWDVAINKYGTLPLFTRRYLTHGIENFAFDALLGKPCLIVAHHQEFKRNGELLMSAINRLNSLRCKLVWRSLGNVVSHSFRMRTDRDGTVILRMYGNHLHLENSSEQARTVEVLKEEIDPSSLRAITMNERPLEWAFRGKFVRFRATIPPNESMDLRTVYADTLGQASYPYDVSYRVGTALRRYLCEARDNYLQRVSH